MSYGRRNETAIIMRRILTLVKEKDAHKERAKKWIDRAESTDKLIEELKIQLMELVGITPEDLLK